MKRFIDLRGQDTGSRFAWWCTVVDKFESFNTYQAWGTWADFEEDYLEDNDASDLDRYRGLCHDWALEPVPDDEDY